MTRVSLSFSLLPFLHLGGRGQDTKLDRVDILCGVSDLSRTCDDGFCGVLLNNDVFGGFMDPLDGLGGVLEDTTTLDGLGGVLEDLLLLSLGMFIEDVFDLFVLLLGSSPLDEMESRKARMYLMGRATFSLSYLFFFLISLGYKKTIKLKNP